MNSNGFVCLDETVIYIVETSEIIGSRQFIGVHKIYGTMFASDRFEIVAEPSILVPVDPACVPDGWESIEYRATKPGDQYLSTRGKIETAFEGGQPHLIVRKKWQASISIPPGWWVYQNCPERWFATDMEPYQSGKFWCRANGSQVWEVTHLNFTPPPGGQPRQVQ